MTLTIHFPEEKAATLKARAATQGLSLEEWLLQLANRDLETMPSSHLQTTDPEEWARLFRSWADSHDPNAPVLSDEAMSRESIYPDRS